MSTGVDSPFWSKTKRGGSPFRRALRQRSIRGALTGTGAANECAGGDSAIPSGRAVVLRTEPLSESRPVRASIPIARAGNRLSHRRSRNVQPYLSPMSRAITRGLAPSG